MSDEALRRRYEAATSFIDAVRPYLNTAQHVDKCGIRNASRQRGAVCTCGRFAAFDALDAYDAERLR